MERIFSFMNVQWIKEIKQNFSKLIGNIANYLQHEASQLLNVPEYHK